MPVANKVHIAGRCSVVRQLRILVSQFHVRQLADRNALRNPQQQSTCDRWLSLQE